MLIQILTKNTSSDPKIAGASKELLKNTLVSKWQDQAG